MCTQSRRAATDPAAVEPMGTPVPPAAAPVEGTDVEAPGLVAVERTPEEDKLVLPRLGDEARVLEQVIEDVGVQDGSSQKFLAERVAINPRALLLRHGKVEQVNCN